MVFQHTLTRYSLFTFSTYHVLLSSYCESYDFINAICAEEIYHRTSVEQYKQIKLVNTYLTSKAKTEGLKNRD